MLLAMQFLTLSVGTTEPFTYAASADRLSTSLIVRREARLMFMLAMVNMNIGEFFNFLNWLDKHMDLHSMHGRKPKLRENIIMMQVGRHGVVILEST
jgi:hypothetical protein